MSRISFFEGQPLEISIVGRVDPEFGHGWIALLPDGTKTILEDKYYALYQFKKDQKVVGVVDRINCAGRVYFEPEHPVYKPGNCYSFAVLGTSEKDFIDGSKERCVTVTDFFGNTIDVVFHNTHTIGRSISLHVKAIHKGRPVLEFPNDTVNQNFSVSFLVTCKITENRKQYFMLEDQGKTNYKLPAHWYKYHKIEVGGPLLCRVWYSTAKDGYRIEPMHPCYKEGDLVDVKPFIRRDTLWARDCFGQIVKIQGNLQSADLPQSVKCKVLRIRKGKPVFLLQNQ